MAVIALRGERASKLLSSCFHAAGDAVFRPGQIRFGNWQAASQSNDSSAASVESGDRATIAVESVVVTPLADDEFEIHCHGGDAAVARILDDLMGGGAEVIDATDWVVPNESKLVREARQVMLQCSTAHTAALAQSQIVARSPGSRPIRLLDWANRWIETTAQGDVDSPSQEQMHQEVQAILACAAWTTRLDRPFHVVFSGPPNVGKSTLVNAIVGYQRSITFDQPGTTRDLLHADTVLNGFAFRLTDTAGLRQIPNTNADVATSDDRPSQDAIERLGMQQVASAVQSADLVVHVHDDQSTSWPTTLNACCLWVRNKADLNAGPTPFAIGHGLNPSSPLRTIATTGLGIGELCDAIVKRLAQPKPADGLPIAVTDRQRNALQNLLNWEPHHDPRKRLFVLRDGTQSVESPH